MSTMATPQATTVAERGSVTLILSDPCDWEGPVADAARLAAASDKRLRVVLADGGEILTAASLDCVHLMASGGGMSTIDSAAARRLLRAQTARLRLEVERLSRRLGREAEVLEVAPGNALGFSAGSKALTFFARRRRGVLLVVHAGTSGTLEIAARLAAERHQAVRLLSASDGDAGDAIRRLLGRWLDSPAISLAPGGPLPRPGPERIAAIVLDPAYVESRKLSLDALLAEVRKLIQAEGA
jgi:hypothetical protein